MATLTIRGVPDEEKEALRVRAAKNGHSMEAELRQIIHEAVNQEAAPEEDLYTAIRRRVEPFGGVEIPEQPDPPREPPTFK